MGIFGPANAEKVVDGLLGIPAREKVAEEIADE
jgi:NAD(P)H-hydrate repair Nnr-like enzyme with NAD(P)H-hydrate epimerase domain